METKMRMLKLGIKQSDLLKMLMSNGIVTDAPELSRAINGCPQERYQKLRAEVVKILDKKEQKHGE